MMLRHQKLCGFLFLLLPVNIIHASNGGGGTDRDFSRNITTMAYHLSPSVQFVSKPFPVQGEDEGQLLTTPHQVSRMIRLCDVEQSDVTLSSAQEERPASPGSPGYLHRIHVKRTDVWPYSPQGHLKLFFGEEEYDGSGVLVGPHHVLTCAHNVYNLEKKTWVNKIVFAPGLKGQTAPFGSADVISIYIDRAWTNGDAAADGSGNIISPFGSACWLFRVSKHE